jgi:hypothetical protein
VRRTRAELSPRLARLYVLAVKLDDLIDSEEMRLLPALRRILFA